MGVKLDVKWYTENKNPCILLKDALRIPPVFKDGSIAEEKSLNSWIHCFNAEWSMKSSVVEKEIAGKKIKIIVADGLSEDFNPPFGDEGREIKLTEETKKEITDILTGEVDIKPKLSDEAIEKLSRRGFKIGSSGTREESETESDGEDEEGGSGDPMVRTLKKIAKKLGEMEDEDFDEEDESDEEEEDEEEDEKEKETTKPSHSHTSKSAKTPSGDDREMFKDALDDPTRSLKIADIYFSGAIYSRCISEVKETDKVKIIEKTICIVMESLAELFKPKS